MDYFGGKAYDRFRSLEENYRKLLMQGMQKTAEETALNSSPEIDTRAFLWTFDSLDEDHELECFFSGLPGFRSSKVVDDPLPGLTEEQKWKLFQALIGLLDRTFSSDLLPEPVKNRRAIICAKAIDPAEIPSAYQRILHRILSGDQHRGLQTADFGRIVRGWSDNSDEETVLLVQAIVTDIVARVQRHDDSWFILASNELGVSETDLRDYAALGDSLSLAILIHITRQQFSHFLKPSWPSFGFSRVLETASKFDVQDTSPDLQHEFCALWNQIVLKAQNDRHGFIAWHILRNIRNVHIALHQDTDSVPTRFSACTSDQDRILFYPSSYPLCNVPGHHPDSTLDMHDDSASTTTVLHDSAAVAPASPASPNAPSSPVPTLLHVDESFTTVPSLDNDRYIPGSFPAAHPTIIESLRIPVTSPDPATAGAIRDIVTSGIIMPRPTSETSTTALLFPHPLPLPSSTTQTS